MKVKNSFSGVLVQQKMRRIQINVQYILKVFSSALLTCIFFSCSPASTKTESIPVSEVKDFPKGKVETSFIYSKSMKLDWNYSAYLPAGYDQDTNSSKKYPVIYLLHGGYGTHQNYLDSFDIKVTLDHMMNAGELPESVVVFPDGFITYYVNGPALAMEDAIIQDLIPQMENKYRIDPTKKNRVIGGLSNGAYGAARFSIKYPQLFCGAFLMSPAVWVVPEKAGVLRMNIFQANGKGFDQKIWDSYHPSQYFDSYVKADSPVQFYIITGKEDPTTTPEMIGEFNNNLKKIAKTEFLVEQGVHDNEFWGPALKKSLLFTGNLLKRQF